ncbi:hypothetical protein HY622_00005, partial [Candidatus Uhrbacteria bacterium]|nr:hypothetical protein [Candidatus Uhrbacteria bacterium]
GSYGNVVGGHFYSYGGLDIGSGSGFEAGGGELYVAGTSKLMGNVGIGTTSPDSGMKLDVRGNMRIGDGSTAEQDILFRNNIGQWEVGINNAGNGTGNSQFYVYDNDYRFTVQRGTGNVGVGTRLPTQGKLVISNGGVANTSGWGGNDLVIGNSNGASAFYHNSDNVYWYTSSGQNIKLRPGGTDNVLVATTAGNVGIGTTSPDSGMKLDVRGNMNASKYCLGGTCIANWSEAVGAGEKLWYKAPSSNGVSNYMTYQVLGWPDTSTVITASEYNQISTVCGASSPSSVGDVCKFSRSGRTRTGTSSTYYYKKVAAMVPRYGYSDVAIGLQPYERSQSTKLYVKGSIFAEAAGGFGTEDADGRIYGQPTYVPILARSDSTAFGIINADDRPAFALNINDNAHTRTARGVPTFYDRYNGGWNASISLKNGNVGIGTPDPRYKLHVTGGDIRVSLLGNSKIALNNDRIGFDVAEIFESDDIVEAGDIVVVSDNERKLKKSANPYDNKVIGVVSSAPAILFEGSDLIIGAKEKRFTKGSKPPIALAGRVPIKISLENGSIKPGDYLTTSSKPGVAMKATKSGMTIGTALESYDQDTEGTILVFLNMGVKNVVEAMEQQQNTIDDLLQRIEKLEAATR